jgi:hypothetical protein
VKLFLCLFLLTALCSCSHVSLVERLHKKHRMRKLPWNSLHNFQILEDHVSSSIIDEKDRESWPFRAKDLPEHL